MKLVKDGVTFDVIVTQDEYVRSPRLMGDSPGKMICFSRRYSIGDPHQYLTPNELFEVLRLIPDTEFEVFNIYAYEHGGISLSISRRGQYADRFDSYQLGYFIFSKKEIDEKYQVEFDGDSWRIFAKDLVEQEITSYNQYLSGDVYSVTIVQTLMNKHFDKDGHFIGIFEEREFVDSCAELYGLNSVACYLKEQGFDVDEQLIEIS